MKTLVTDSVLKESILRLTFFISFCSVHFAKFFFQHLLKQMQCDTNSYALQHSLLILDTIVHKMTGYIKLEVKRIALDKQQWHT